MRVVYSLQQQMLLAGTFPRFQRGLLPAATFWRGHVPAESVGRGEVPAESEEMSPLKAAYVVVKWAI